MNNKPFAAFVLSKTENGLYAATTRPYDKETPIGLPGGKVEEGETPMEAALRESEEEGWKMIGINPNPILKKTNHHGIIFWFTAEKAIKLDDYKEKQEGIVNIEVSLEEIARSGNGNEFIMNIVGCGACGGHDILHQEKEGRGLPPKGWVRKVGDKRRISWRGTWDVWTCNSCGKTWNKLRM